MENRYCLTFKKEGYAIYTSHLDMQRLFKRAFKRAGIEIAYSHGYNPHPLMSFVQPLSLGYSSVCEMLEFRTKEPYMPEFITAELAGVMPEGIAVTACERLEEGKKTLASRCCAAVYEIVIPVGSGDESVLLSDPDDIVSRFLDQKEITVTKLNKKKKLVETDIRDKIQDLKMSIVDNNVLLNTKLDAGSDSNLSPELLLKAFLPFSGIDTDRSEIEISRLELICK